VVNQTVDILVHRTDSKYYKSIFSDNESKSKLLQFLVTVSLGCQAEQLFVEAATTSQLDKCDIIRLYDISNHVSEKLSQLGVPEDFFSTSIIENITRKMASHDDDKFEINPKSLFGIMKLVPPSSVALVKGGSAILGSIVMRNLLAERDDLSKVTRKDNILLETSLQYIIKSDVTMECCLQSLLAAPVSMEALTVVDKLLMIPEVRDALQMYNQSVLLKELLTHQECQDFPVEVQKLLQKLNVTISTLL